MLEFVTSVPVVAPPMKQHCWLCVFVCFFKANGFISTTLNGRLEEPFAFWCSRFCWAWWRCSLTCIKRVIIRTSKWQKDWQFRPNLATEQRFSCRHKDVLKLSVLNYGSFQIHQLICSTCSCASISSCLSHSAVQLKPTLMFHFWPPKESQRLTSVLF